VVGRELFDLSAYFRGLSETMAAARRFSRQAVMSSMAAKTRVEKPRAARARSRRSCRRGGIFGDDAWSLEIISCGFLPDEPGAALTPQKAEGGSSIFPVSR